MSRRLIIISLLMGLLLSVGCGKKEAKNSVSFKFQFDVNGQALDTNQVYLNKAGNKFKVLGLKYFISGIKLKRSDGSIEYYNNSASAHLIDIKDEESLEWNLPFVKKGVYKSIGFNFGLDEEINSENKLILSDIEQMRYDNEALEGYFYMIADIKWWSDNLELPQEFSLKLGRCPLITGNTFDNINTYNEYYQAHEFEIPFDNKEGEHKEFIVSMDIRQWFQDPTTIDFSEIDYELIPYDHAFQSVLKQNGKNAFSMVLINKRK